MNQKLSRELVGKVISDKMDKTIVVKITRQVKHPVYGKYIRRSTKVHANDVQNIAKIGDTVLIVETKPISKTKSWNLKKVLEENQGSKS